MFFLKKFISYLILPPGVFIALLMFIAVLSRKRKVVYIPAVAGAISLYLISIEPFKDLLVYPLESPFKPPRVVRGDFIVVLGGGAYNSGYLKASSYKRLITGFLLHRRTGKPLILSGGASIGTIPEAKVMKELLLEFGVEERDIYADLRSRDTFENAKYVNEICRRAGCKSITLVTSAFHMRRALHVFRKTGLEVQPYPTDFKFEGRYNLYSAFPKYSVFYDSSIAIREYVGLLFYRFFY
ncbi:YdcF family protein [Hydrogenivirga sp.]